MGYSSRESTKGKGIKGIDGLGVGVFYYYSAELTQHDQNTAKALDDKKVEAMAISLDKEADGDLKKLKEKLASKDRFKVPGYGDYVTVKYIDQELWITA